MRSARASDKVWPLTGLPAVIDRADRKLVLCHGCFDPLHAGHVAHLEEAADKGDILVVTVTSDRFVTLAKGRPRPFMTDRNRAMIIAALGCVDFVAVNHDEDARKLLAMLRPDVYVKGKDYQSPTMRDVLKKEVRVVELYGGVLEFTKSAKQSSTDLLRRLMACV